MCAVAYPYSDENLIINEILENITYDQFLRQAI